MNDDQQQATTTRDDLARVLCRERHDHAPGDPYVPCTDSREAASVVVREWLPTMRRPWYEEGKVDGAAEVVARVADDLLTDWGTELGRDDVMGVHAWIMNYTALTPGDDQGRHEDDEEDDEDHWSESPDLDCGDR